MPFNGSGVYALPSTTVTPAVSGTTIDSSEFNTFTADLETALTLCVAKDGQTSSPILTNPKILTKILDTNSNELVEFGTTASAVNHVKTTNAATGNGVSIAAVGDDTNIELSLAGKGTGGAYGTLTTHTGSPFATTSGSSVSVTGIPSWVKKITISFNGVSIAADANSLSMQIGDSGGLHTTGYDSVCNEISASGNTTQQSTSVFLLNSSTNALATDDYNGHAIITLADSSNFDYVFSLVMNNSAGDHIISSSQVSLDTVLTQFQLATSSTFDAGSFSVHYEG